MPDGNRKPGSDTPDPEKLAKLLEIELMQKRAGWQQAKERRGAVRAASFFFLFVIIAGALVAWWLFFSPDRVQELKQAHPQPNESTPATTASP
jgi:hypothetical protein